MAFGSRPKENVSAPFQILGMLIPLAGKEKRGGTEADSRTAHETTVEDEGEHPFRFGAVSSDNAGMAQITIRCHPRVPVPTEELEVWLKREVDHLRDEVPLATVRLSSLTQHLPSADIDVGWLIELELPDDEPSLEGRDLAVALRDMQLLGLQPTLLTRATEYGTQGPSSFAFPPATIRA
jgi:hypothetical protein